MTLDLAELLKRIKNERKERIQADQTQEMKLAELNNSMTNVVTLLSDIKKGLVGDEYVGEGLVPRFEKLERKVVTKQDLETMMGPFKSRMTALEKKMSWNEKFLIGTSVSLVIELVLIILINFVVKQ